MESVLEGTRLLCHGDGFVLGRAASVECHALVPCLGVHMALLGHGIGLLRPSLRCLRVFESILLRFPRFLHCSLRILNRDHPKAQNEPNCFALPPNHPDCEVRATLTRLGGTFHHLSPHLLPLVGRMARIVYQS